MNPAEGLIDVHACGDTAALNPALRGPAWVRERQPCGLWPARLELTTKADHNGIRHEPILADTPWPQAQVSDGIRHSARILQPGGLAAPQMESL